MAQDGKVALEKLEQASSLPSLIILDLMMPVMDGFEFREEQEKNPRLALVPVVIMTADGNIESKRLRVGASDQIRKPVDIDRVLEIAQRFAS